VARRVRGGRRRALRTKPEGRHGDIMHGMQLVDLASCGSLGLTIRGGGHPNISTVQ
jgi:hypothetical protein